MAKSEMLLIFLASAGLFLALLVFSFLSFTSGFRPTLISEAPLNKSAEFSPMPGDGLAYSYASPDFNGTVVFLFGRKILPSTNLSQRIYANCTLAVIEGLNSSTCINPDGTDGNGNAGLAGGFFFFSPWMLAASENLSWNGSVLNSIDRSELDFLSVAFDKREVYKGRAALVFNLTVRDLFKETRKRVWVDSSERIVLKEESENESMELIQGYFPLQPQAE
ncbi:MAG: hypothetical protein PHS02_03175 [Candidatus ainarchaeum sp.]|nr:hypothetical protein [Candidatus ainarchaeum sp.]